jgi:DNA-binding response OmpR family regulator
MTTSTDKPVGKVLLAEDDGSIAFIINFIIKREGFEVDIASDGKQTMEQIEKGGPYTLAIIDIMMPFYDGFQLIEKIRSLEHWKDTPVIVLSSLSQEKNIVRALQLGANDYIVKPFQPGELIARIKRFT